MASLVPNIDSGLILGIKVPKVKALAKSLYSTPDGERFLNNLPHKYFDENNLHMQMINLEKDFNVHTKYDDLVTEKICDICINLLKNYIEYYSPKKFKTTQILENIK